MENIKEKTAILIPAYMPDQRLVSLVDELYASGFSHQLIINDGSDADCEPVFAQIREREFCRLLVHEVNMGKGQALKTGFQEFCRNMPECDYIVTADADGQHCCKDIINVAVAANEYPQKLILGVRNFAQKHVPLHNKLGNNITKGVISLYLGNPISDTQTGLRAMSKSLAENFLDLAGQRYEYEINMLLECKSRRISIHEVPIDTIYINNNETSHFDVVKDSTKIYIQIIKYALSSGFAALIDIGLFTILANLLLGQKYYIFTATLIARICSLFVNYFANKKAVFKSDEKNSHAMAKYFVLCAANIALATWFTNLLVQSAGMGLFISKLLVSAVLFVLNFILQKNLIF